MKSIADQDVLGQFETCNNISFGEGEADPANEKALAYADAVCAMLQAKMMLEQSKSKVPSYTAQWRDADYYQNEQQTYNRACDRLYQIACSTR